MTLSQRNTHVHHATTNVADNKHTTTVGNTYAGGKFAWEKWTGGGLESPKMIAGAMIGGAVATSAGTIMNAMIGN
ncbi:hypothetical protein ACIO52_02710 [Nocardia sp. NPDC087230]|uniref:hypothetical protein n=1 Tax=Nocardia sp. NPDC087230 TaxID=3364331 RepID=UPI003817BB63